MKLKEMVKVRYLGKSLDPEYGDIGEAYPDDEFGEEYYFIYFKKARRWVHILKSQVEEIGM